MKLSLAAHVTRWRKTIHDGDVGVCCDNVGYCCQDVTRHIGVVMYASIDDDD